MRMRLNDRVYRPLILLNTVVLLGIVLGGGLLGAVYRERIKIKLTEIANREKASSKFLNYMSGAKDQPSEIDFSTYEIKISPKYLRQLQTQIQQLSKTGIMTGQLKTWYPAYFFHGGEDYKVKIRVRGDLGNHWAHEKKSWRVKFKKEKLFEGRREIDLIIPWDKAYEVETVAYDVARELGLLVPDAGFCRVRINGVDFGAYLWMEKYGPEMLEKQGYPVGDIIKYRNVWAQTYLNGFGLRKSYIPGSYENTIVQDLTAGYSMERWDELMTLLRKADDVAFRNGIGHLIKMEQFLTWNAVTWLFGSQHAHAPDNLRWYYDNTSGLFEPILYDVHRRSIRRESPKATQLWNFESGEINYLVRRIIQIPEYRQQRNRILWNILTDDRYDVAGRCEQYFRQHRPYLFTGAGARSSQYVDEFHEETIRILEANRQDLRDHLEFARIFVTPVVASKGMASTLRLRLIPDSKNFIRLERLSLKLGAYDAQRAHEGRLRATLTDLEGQEKEVSFTSFTPDDSTLVMEFPDIEVWNPVDDQLRKVEGEWVLEIDLGNLDLSSWRDSGSLPYLEARYSNSITGDLISDEYMFVDSPLYSDRQLDQSPLVLPIQAFVADSGLPFLVEGNVLTLSKGTHRIEKDLIVPAGYGVHLQAGTVLEMAPEVSFVCYGPLLVTGTKSQPVSVVPQDERAPFGSLAVVRANAMSRVSYLRIHGGSETHINGLYLSGQLCFYWSDVELDHCLVYGARADDGLNAKKARITIDHCVFVNNAADGVDADWVNGKVENSLFLANGGDGIDFSGSRVAIRNCLFQGSGDKGISVGEQSEILGFNNIIRDCVIGTASKDLSHVDLYASVFYQNETGIALYRKKQLFGGATAKVVGCLFWDNAQDLSLDSLSAVEAVATAVNLEPGDHAAVKELLPGYPGDYYVVDEQGRFVHDQLKLQGSPFLITLDTESIEVEGVTVPVLTGSPAGLVSQLTLPLDIVEQLKGMDAKEH